MQDKLIGYLLGALEAEETTYVEQALQADEETRRQLEVLRSGMAPLEADRGHIDAPANLAIRTCQQIQEVRNLTIRKS